MISASFFTGALAIIAVKGVNAGPCRPSTIATTDTTVTVGSAATEASIATSEATTLTPSSTVDVTAITTELTTISEDVSSTATSFDDTTTLVSITTTTAQENQDSTTVPATTTTTTAAAEEFKCTTNTDCQALNGGANPFCDAGSCVANSDQGSLCSDNSDCTTPGETCSADGFCGASTTQPRDACIDSNDCLLSVDPLCTLGLCVCSDALCSHPPGVQTCIIAAQCDAGQSCQQGVCVDDVSCSVEEDCVANLDLCTFLGICACVNGLCSL